MSDTDQKREDEVLRRMLATKPRRTSLRRAKERRGHHYPRPRKQANAIALAVETNDG